jgi:dihydroorotase-like cyclic amidohydrolase
MAALWHAGVVSFETMLCDGMPGETYVDDDDAALHEMLADAARLGARVGLYSGDQALVDAAIARLRGAGRTDFPAFAESRPPESETRGLARLAKAQSATGAKVIMRQVSTAQGFAIAAMAKRNAAAGKIRLEVTPHHLHLDIEVLARLGAHAQMLPPLRSSADIKAAQQAAADGTADFIGSDHAPHALEEKCTRECWSCPSGTAGLDTLAAATLDLAARGAISYMQVASLIAEQPARIFGLGHRKGHIAVGADADLVLIDSELAFPVTPQAIHSRAGRSPFEGRVLRGRPVLTVLRGEVIAENGKLVAKEPGGRFLSRATERAS